MRWILFPRCNVVLQIDDEEPIPIGYPSPKHALQNFIDNGGLSSAFKREYDVRSTTIDGVDIAYVVERTDVFRDWGFAPVPAQRRNSGADNFPPVATCIEGVAVEEFTPGFRSRSILAIANATGAGAPKTNVARSALEDTPELRQMLKGIYHAYASHVEDESERLRSEESFSLTHATDHAKYTAARLSHQSSIKDDILADELQKVPVFVVEEVSGRRKTNVKEVVATGAFVTVESPLRRSIEQLVREAPTDIKAQDLLEIFGSDNFSQENVKTICNLSSYSNFDRQILKQFEISSVDAYARDKRLRLHWNLVGNSRSWLSLADVDSELIDGDRQFLQMLYEAWERVSRGNPLSSIAFPLSNIKSAGLDEYGMFMSRGHRYLAPTSALAKYVRSLATKEGHDFKRLAVLLLVLESFEAMNFTLETVNSEAAQRVTSQVLGSELANYFEDGAGFLEAIGQTNKKIFDPFAWDKRDYDA